MRLIKNGTHRQAGRPAGRVRPPGAAPQRARSARRADRLRAADQEAPGRRSRRASATDDSTLMQAESTQERARLELVKNDMLPKIQAEKNTLAFEEARGQAEAAAGNLRAQAARRRRRHQDPRDPPRSIRDEHEAGGIERRADADHLAAARRRRHQDDVQERRQHGRVHGRGRSAPGPAGRRSRQPRGDARARPRQPGRHERAARRASRSTSGSTPIPS